MSFFLYVILCFFAGKDGKYKPVVSYSFPPKVFDSDMSSSSDAGLHSIPAFCFPDMDRWTAPVSSYSRLGAVQCVGGYP